MRCPASRRRVRWPDRSCRWWPPPSAPINCSAVPARGPAAVDALAARTLVKGEPLAPPAGRADDFAWPRREVGREQAKGETPVASTAPDGTVAAPGAPPKPAVKKQVRPIQPGPPSVGNFSQPGSPSVGNFFGFGARPAARQPPPPAAAARLRPRPRPPANVGRSASVPAWFHAIIDPHGEARVIPRRRERDPESVRSSLANTPDPRLADRRTRNHETSAQPQ